jgi:hypothetical protein
MMKKILICAVIALILVPASVIAAGFGGRATGTAPGQGLCVQDGQNCLSQKCQQGTGTQEQYRYGAQPDGVKGARGGQGVGTGQCTSSQNQTRSRLRLHDGSCGGCKNTT